MEYLTYPFHNPSLAIPPSGPSKRDASAINDSNDKGQESLAATYDPLIRKNTTNSTDSSYSSLALADPTSPALTGGNDDSSVCFEDNEDDESRTIDSRSISNLSTTSSQLFVQKHNAAFEKLRTAVGAGLQSSGSAGMGGIPDEWKGYQPPSLNKGHWRTFGPTEAVLIVADGPRGPHHGEPAATGSYRHVKRRLDNAKTASLWKGTIWLTETQLIFVLLKDAAPERVDPAEMDASSHTESWVSSLRKMLGHGHRRDSEDGTGEGVGTSTDPETGYPITAFQIPLDSLLQVKLKKPHKHRGRSSSAKRNSAASSTTGGLWSPPGSTPISPALSRIQSRNARSLTRHESHRSLQHQHREASSPGAATPAAIADAHRGRTSTFGYFGDAAHLPTTPPTHLETEQQQPLDFGALINRKEDPLIVIVYSETAKNAARVQFRFESGLYADEANDLVEKLKEYVRKK
ncbi:hypothetical protein P389DRAFT_18744 [Cystobasidium minutum MCA 4210]|uniref:uncharacterized protein n=1 Tax=Cystobasidium minutum MCA 4210 TaxID=1397322 RepID=UPI0034CE4A89|eukprot:jgi/Rhomi1/18744/CE18743_479